MLVQKLRANIKKNVNLDELANEANKKRMIEKVNLDDSITYKNTVTP